MVGFASFSDHSRPLAPTIPAHRLVRLFRSSSVFWRIIIKRNRLVALSFG